MKPLKFINASSAAAARWSIGVVGRARISETLWDLIAREVSVQNLTTSLMTKIRHLMSS